jgi:hypothetical protein
MKATTNVRSKEPLIVYLGDNILWIIWGAITFWLLLTYTALKYDPEGQLHHVGEHWTSVPFAVISMIGLVFFIIKHLRLASKQKKISAEVLPQYTELCEFISTAKVTDKHVLGIEALRESPVEFVSRLESAVRSMTQSKNTLKERLNEARSWLFFAMMIDNKEAVPEKERREFLRIATDEFVALMLDVERAIRRDLKIEADEEYNPKQLFEMYLAWVGAKKIEIDAKQVDIDDLTARNRSLHERLEERRMAMYDLQTERDQARAAHLDHLHAAMHFLYHLRPEVDLGKLQASALRGMLQRTMLPSISRRRIGFAASYIELLGPYGIHKLKDLPYIGEDYEAGPPSNSSLRTLLKEAVNDAFRNHELIGTDGRVIHPCAQELIGLCMMDPREKAVEPAPPEAS